MITRAYVVTMPFGGEGGGDPATPVDILVQNDPGTEADPVVTAINAQYYEWRGRPLRFESLAGDAGFVPRMTLGLTLSLMCLDVAPQALPSVRLSASLAALSANLGTPFPDPSGQPAIRLTGSTGTAGIPYLLTVQITQMQDEDQAPRRNG